MASCASFFCRFGRGIWCHDNSRASSRAVSKLGGKQLEKAWIECGSHPCIGRWYLISQNPSLLNRHSHLPVGCSGKAVQDSMSKKKEQEDRVRKSTAVGSLGIPPKKKSQNAEGEKKGETTSEHGATPPPPRKRPENRERASVVRDGGSLSQHQRTLADGLAQCSAVEIPCCWEEAGEGRFIGIHWALQALPTLDGSTHGNCW